jgi:hypothetical protein
MDSDSGDSLKWMASGKVHVGDIGDGGMSGRCHWWTRGVALVRLWDLDVGVQGINGRKDADDFTA